MLILIFLLLVCHWLADFTGLSTSRMLEAKSIGKPLFPIFLHACTHGFLMMIVLFFYTSISTLIILVIFEVLTHFLIDTLKGRSNVWFPELKDMSKSSFWMILGFDQLLHQIVILLMVSFIYS